MWRLGVLSKRFFSSTGGLLMRILTQEIIKKFLAIVCALTAATPLLAEKINGSDIFYQSWSGAAYYNDETGEFSHCAISAEYVSGNTLYFSVNSDVSITVAVAGDLRLQPGSQFPVALYVDRRTPIYGTAYAHDEGFATLNIQDLAGALHSFRKGYNLRIESAAGSSNYSLRGTYRALEAAMNCARKHYTFVAERPSQQIDRSGLFQLATVIIADMGLPNFRYMTDAELEEEGMSGSVAWIDEDASVFGLVTRVNYVEGASLQETDAADTEWVSQSCDGDLATYARSIPATDNGIKGREIRLLCNEDGKESQAFVNKFAFGDSVYYTVLIFGEDHNHATQPAAQNERSYLKSVSYVTGQQ